LVHKAVVLSVALTWLSVGFAQSVFVSPSDAWGSFGVPGSKLTLSSVDAAGSEVTLPDDGRYLLWILDSVYAADARARIPWSDLGGAQDDDSLVSNPIALVPSFGAGYVVVYDGVGMLPAPDARAAVATQLSEQVVLFDDTDTLAETVLEGAFSVRPRVEGLYLMEGQTVRYRYVLPFMWENVSILELIQDAAETFLAGGEPALAPVAATRGGRLSDGVNLNVPALVLRATAEALEGEPLPSPLTQAGGTVTIRPAENDRFLLETLPDMLAQYGVSGVALIDDAADDATFDALREVFPGWTFIDMSVPEVRLVWLEVQTVIIDDEGQVLGSAILSPADGHGRYPNWLSDILQEASSR
jgi:hypothetical protein